MKALEAREVVTNLEDVIVRNEVEVEEFGDIIIGNKEHKKSASDGNKTW